MVRIQKKNDIDMKNMEDLKALMKLQGSASNAQVEALTEQAAQEEVERQQEETVTNKVTQIKKEVDQEIKKKDDTKVKKVKELSSKLGVKAL